MPDSSEPAMPDSSEPVWEPSEEVAGILRDALAAAEEEAWEEAARILGAALDIHSGDPYLLCWMGLAERELGEEGSAYERFRMALAADPRDPVLLATAGNALAAFDDPAAEGALRTAALLAPDLPQARWMYGAYLAREGLYADALRELNAAVTLDPEDPLIRVEQGVALALSEDFEGAEGAFSHAAELDPEDGWALLLLGLVRLELGETDDAARILDEGARSRPEDLDAQLVAGLALAAAGREDLALEMIERARIHAAQQDARILGEVEDRIGEGPEEALAFLRETLGPSSLRERLLQRP